MAIETTSILARIPRRAGPRSCLMVALAPTLAVVLFGVGNAAETEIVAPVRPNVTSVQPAPTPVQLGQPVAKPAEPVVTQVPEASEREKWRQTMQNTPKPKNGCFTATYPQTEWREVPCKTPSNKLYPPKLAPTATIGGAGTNFSAQVSGHLTQAEGSFDSVTGVTSECSVACPFNASTNTAVCPANPSCSGKTFKRLLAPA